MTRLGAAPLLAAVTVVMLSACRAGRVYFPGPSIGPAPPALWQSLHTLRQARRLDGQDDGAPELRAAGVRIGQKYSDLEQPPQQPESDQVPPLGDGEPADPQPLGPVDILGPLDIRDLSDNEQTSAPRPVRVNDAEHQQNSENLQSLSPLPIFLAVDPKDPEGPTNVPAGTPEPRGVNSIVDLQNPETFVSFGNRQPDPANDDFRRPTPDGFSNPNPDDVITLDEAFDINKPAFVSGLIPEGVVFAAATADDFSNNEEDLSPPDGEEQLPRRPDLQSSASVFDSTSVDRPEPEGSVDRPPSDRDPVRTRPATVAVASGPLRSDQNLLNLLVTQGVLRPVGRVRVAQLRLVSDTEQEAEDEDESGVFFAPARSDNDVTVELVGGEELPQAFDERRQYRAESNPGPTLEADNTEPDIQPDEKEGWETSATSDDAREQVLASNIVPILSEKEVFDRLVTPRASTSSKIAGTGSSTDTTPPPDESEDVPPVAEDDEPEQPAVTPRVDSLAARLTELSSRVSRQGTWGRRVSNATPRGGADGADSGRRYRWQDAPRSGWQRRDDVAEPVFVDTAALEASEDLNAAGSERHEELAVLEDNEDALQELVMFDEETSEQAEEVSEDEEIDGDRSNALEEMENRKPAPKTKHTGAEIFTERTASFRTENSTEDEEAGPPQLVGEMHNCPELGGSVTLECRVKNPPQHDQIKRFWWVRRHFDDDHNAVKDDLLAVGGTSLYSANNTSIQQVGGGTGGQREVGGIEGREGD
ncbi:hypothetical protein FJT64_000020 [Amphibalanus amphitrite]|uniref:Ig-like domain-containing protein n=1 Tax=Amphibalanus amphitrite TaxID=1232801 RepID=A0A6A4XBE7_AMPAM|nr:hypothetical protein FJT64_000020 [Amphibalanus amphitrite]KAF0314750.1 hypothetical protein FJT64_000020 [Amphibalanus amphitrite]